MSLVPQSLVPEVLPGVYEGGDDRKCPAAQWGDSLPQSQVSPRKSSSPKTGGALCSSGVAQSTGKPTIQDLQSKRNLLSDPMDPAAAHREVAGLPVNPRNPTARVLEKTWSWGGPGAFW